MSLSHSVDVPQKGRHPGATAALRAAQSLEIETERLADSTYVVSVAGEIDCCTGPQFKAALANALDAGAVALIVDLSDCGFMDSTGLGILHLASERLNNANKPVAVVTVDATLRSAIQIVGLDEVLGVYPTRLAAVNGGLQV
jgi:anti-sigma B factor antagonist